MTDKINGLDWPAIVNTMHEKGYAVVPGVLSKAQCQHLIDQFDNTEGYRKTVVMERSGYGLGSYKYWDYPLPPFVQNLRETLYPRLAPIANTWMQLLGVDKSFPTTFHDLQAQCHVGGQRKPTPLILKYGKGGFNLLHQDLYGDVYFPLQTAFVLSQPGKDYTGGEFVLTQQTYKAQSKAIVLTPQQGDMIIFTTNFRPVKSSKGYSRATMKHGISELHSGERYTMGIIFHDAAS